MMRDARGRGRRRAGRAAACVACVGAVGCTALLGDFTSGGTGPAGLVSLLVDGSAGDAGSARDALPPGDAPVPGETGGPSRLTCSTWRYASPIVLEVLSAGNRRIIGTVDIVSEGTARARVIAGKASTSVSFSVFTVDKAPATPQVTEVDAPSMLGGQFATLRRGVDSAMPSTTVVTYAGEAADAGVLGAFSAYVLPDTMPATGPLPAPFVVYRETPLFPEVDTIRVLPLEASTSDGANQYTLFTAVTYPSPTQSTDHVLGVGQATAGPGGEPATLYTVVTTPNLGDVKDPHMLQSGDSVYIYDENDPSSAGLSAWKVPALAPVIEPPPKRAVSAGMPARLLGLTNAAGGAEIAYEADTASGAYTTSITYLAGTIPDNQLDTWTPTDLVTVATFADVFTAPAGIPCGSAWTNDNLMLLGPGLRNASDDGGVAPGMNLLWFDATGTLRSSGSGTNALLTDRDDFTNVAASPAQISADGARWDIVWVETKSDDAGLYDTVLYDELDCQL